MAAYLFRRALRSLFVVLFVATIVFILLRLSGDPVVLLLGPEATPQQVAQLRHELGFDRPLYVQFGQFLARLMRGDFGQSLVYGVPAISLLAERFPNTAQLALAAIGLSVLVSVPLGVLSAVKQGGAVDRIAVPISILAQSMPSFWLGIMLILIMSVNLRILPTSGKDGPLSIVLPAITLSSVFLARFTLLLRTSMIEALSEDYIRTARGKGLGEHAVYYSHALRNAIIPLVTMIGMDFGRLLGGAVITETVFAWPGIGYLALQSVYARDYAVVQASIIVLAFCVLICNWLVDLLYSVLDPRIAIT